jgi:hypothetical protein
MFVFLVVMEMYVHVINYSHCIPIIAKMADLRLEAQGQARQSSECVCVCVLFDWLEM